MSTTTKAPPNPDDLGRGPMIMGLCWTFTFLALVSVVLRFHIRWKVGNRWFSDDWLMLVAQLFLFMQMGFVTKAFVEGLGKLDANLLPGELQRVLKWCWIQTPPCVLVSVISRISITVLLIRLFGLKIWFKWFLIFFTTLAALAHIALILVIFLSVSPVQGLWEVTMPARRANPNIEKYVAYLGQSILTFTDFTYVVLPIAVIWNLNTTLRRKLELCLVMALGLVTMAFALVKLHGVGTVNLVSPAYTNSLQFLWAVLEEAMVIIMGCIPVNVKFAKIEMPSVLRSITSPIRSLLSATAASKSKQSSKAPSASSSFGAAAYHDIELGSHKLGRLHLDDETTKIKGPSHDTTATYFENGSNKDLVKATPEATVRRMDQFTITYDNKSVKSKESSALRESV